MKTILCWLDDRIGYSETIKPLIEHPVPPTGWDYTIGSAALIAFTVQVVTGVALAFSYVPTPDHAYESLEFITSGAILGSVVRGIHFWGASLLIVVALLHMTFVFWTGGYRAPREVNWMVGVIVFLLILAFSLTGSLLPWDVNSYLARGRELSILSGSSVLPGGVSEFLKNVLQGGPIIGPATLLRFYIAHVFLLPAVIVGLMYVHFRLVRRQGPAEPS